VCRGARPLVAHAVKARRRVSKPLRQDEHHARVVRQHISAAAAAAAGTTPAPARRCGSRPSRRGIRSCCWRCVLQRVDALAAVAHRGGHLGLHLVARRLGGAKRVGVLAAASGDEAAKRSDGVAHARRGAAELGALARRGGVR
jgi:hypothetical protein